MRRSDSRGSIHRKSQARASNTRVSDFTLCPLGQSKKAIGLESPIGPCIATHRVDNRQACCFRNDGCRHNSEMEPQDTTIDSSPRTRRPIAALGPEEDHSRSGRSNGWAECREKKIGVQPTGRIFLLTFLFIGILRFARLSGPIRVRHWM